MLRILELIELSKTKIDTKADSAVQYPRNTSKHIASERKLVSKPNYPCRCGYDEWWQRQDSGWVCGVCHPNPGIPQKETNTSDSTEGTHSSPGNNDGKRESDIDLDDLS